jgi:beta-glucosidase
MRIEPAQIHAAGTAHILVDVKNTGGREGTEPAQLYIHDVLGSVSTPVKQLRGFARLQLKPGETRTADFVLGPEDLMLLNLDKHWVVEPGKFEIMVGSSSADIRAKGSLEVAP